MSNPQRFSIRHKDGPLNDRECEIVRHFLRESVFVRNCNLRFNQHRDVSKVTLHIRGFWDYAMGSLVVRYAFNLLDREFDVELDRPTIYKETEEPSFPPDRVWKVWVPEAMMEMQYPTYDEALEWALLPSEERERLIEEDFAQEGGW